MEFRSFLGDPAQSQSSQYESSVRGGEVGQQQVEEEELHPSISHLPDYIPLHPSLVRDFEKATIVSNSSTKIIDDCIKTLINNTRAYINYSLENDHLLDPTQYQPFLKQQLQLLTKLLKQKFEIGVLRNSIESSKAKIKQRLLDEPEFTIETLPQYHESSDLSVGDSLIADYDESKQQHRAHKSLESVFNSSNYYTYLKSASFILDNPEKPLPDEEGAGEVDGADYDDLGDIAIAGGKIPLKDPLSMNLFENPVKSQRCNHVFEKQHVVNSISRRNKCPIDGCDATISLSDLIPDELMKLRVQVYLAKEKHKKPNTAVERL